MIASLITEAVPTGTSASTATRSEEHTSELQSPDHLVCRLLLEKKNNTYFFILITTSPPENYTLSLHDALPISIEPQHAGAGHLIFLSQVKHIIERDAAILYLIHRLEHDRELDHRGRAHRYVGVDRHQIGRAHV